MQIPFDPLVNLPSLGARALVFCAAAKLHPSRTYYYRKNLDVDKLIEQCTAKVV